jgi:hypothetical protein
MFLAYLFIDTFWIMYWQLQAKVPKDSFDLLMDREPDSLSVDELEKELAELSAWELTKTEQPEQWSEVLRYGDKIEL